MFNVRRAFQGAKANYANSADSRTGHEDRARAVANNSKLVTAAAGTWP